LIRPYLNDKAKSIVSKLTPDVAGDYSRLKDTLLHEFKLFPNTYLERFNSCRKSGAQSFGARPQSYGAPAQTPPAPSVTPFAPRFNFGTSGAGRGSDSGHTFVPRNRCFECGSTRHIRQNCPQLTGKTPLKPEGNVSRVGVGVLRN